MSDFDPIIEGRPLSELKVADLRKELEKHGLLKVGLKSVLSDRLKQFILKHESETTKHFDEKHQLSASSPPQSTSNPLVAEYLATQQQALQQARKAADEVRAGVSPDISTPIVVNNGRHEEEDEENEEEDNVEEAEEAAEMKEDRSKEGDGEDLEDDEQEEEDEQEEKDEDEEGRDEKSESPARKETEESDEEQEDQEAMVQEDSDELEKLREEAQKSVGEKRTNDGREVLPVDDDVPRRDRRRKWGSCRSAKRPDVVAISADSLKDMMKEAQDIEDNRVELDYDDDQVDLRGKRVVVAENDDLDEEQVDLEGPKRVVVQCRDESASIGMQVVEESLKDDAGDTEEMTEDGLRRSKELSPARYPSDRVLHVRCLTRPFTVKGLFELLEKSGTLDRSQFWIDRIKTNCLAKFSTEEEASNARTRLHNVVWPLSNPKCLRVDFANQEVLDRHLKADEREAMPVVKNDKENVRRSREEPNRQRFPSENTADLQRKRKRSNQTPERTPMQSREWDRGKKFQMGESPPHRTRRTTPPVQSDRHLDPRPTTKILDDLFKKTKSTPAIYWMPLDDHQIAQRMGKKPTLDKPKRSDVGSHNRHSSPIRHRRPLPTPARRR